MDVQDRVLPETPSESDEAELAWSVSKTHGIYFEFAHKRITVVVHPGLSVQEKGRLSNNIQSMIRLQFQQFEWTSFQVQEGHQQ